MKTVKTDLYTALYNSGAAFTHHKVKTGYVAYGTVIKKNTLFKKLIRACKQHPQVTFVRSDFDDKPSLIIRAEVSLKKIPVTFEVKN